LNSVEKRRRKYYLQLKIEGIVDPNLQKSAKGAKFELGWFASRYCNLVSGIAVNFLNTVLRVIPEYKGDIEAY
jgi:hypothetical protein